MAAKDNLSHEVLGSFTGRVAPAGAGAPACGTRRREHCLRATQSFKKTLGQWIGSSGHRKNLPLHNASRVGIASAKDASGKRTYWAVVIAGDYEPKPGKGKRDKEPLVAVKRETAPLRPAQIQRLPHQGTQPLHLRLRQRANEMGRTAQPCQLLGFWGKIISPVLGHYIKQAPGRSIVRAGSTPSPPPQGHRPQ